MHVADRGGVDIRKYVIWNSGVEGVCTVMRKHIDEIGKNEELALAGVTALRMFVAGDDAGLIAGSAADVAHTMTEAMTKYAPATSTMRPSPPHLPCHAPLPSSPPLVTRGRYLGIEAVVDAMMYHLENETIQENGAAVIANVASVDLGAKRIHQVNAGAEVADTQATRNLIDALIPVCKAIKRFPRIGSPRHALHVLVANLGSPKEAYEAGAERDWLPHDLQYDKDSSEKL